MTFQKRPTKPQTVSLDRQQTIALVRSQAERLIRNGKINTNELFMGIVKEFFGKHLVFAQVSFLGILSKYFYLDKDGFWHLPSK